MRMVDKLLDERQKQRNNSRGDDDGPDQIEIYMEPPLMQPLDTAKSVFDQGVAERWGGINTERSVFDRQAVFRVSKTDGQE